MTENKIPVAAFTFPQPLKSLLGLKSHYFHNRTASEVLPAAVQSTKPLPVRAEQKHRSFAPSGKGWQLLLSACRWHAIMKIQPFGLNALPTIPRKSSSFADDKIK